MLLPRIDFYLLESSELKSRWLLACRLIEKAYNMGHRIYVQCDDQKDAEYFDELLWSFKPESFIPHNLQDEGPEPPPPIQIGYNKDPKTFKDILLNLSTNIPEFYPRFKRVLEIVSNNESQKELSRKHYRVYKKKGCKLYTHTFK